MSKHSLSEYVSSGDIRECLKRVFMASECRTQGELAELLGIGQSSISDAKKRGCVPYEWIVMLFIKKRINPGWILTGEGPRVAKFVQDEVPSPLESYSTDELVQEIVRRGVRGLAERVP